MTPWSAEGSAEVLCRMQRDIVATDHRQSGTVNGKLNFARFRGICIGRDSRYWRI